MSNSTYSRYWYQKIVDVLKINIPFQQDINYKDIFIESTDWEQQHIRLGLVIGGIDLVLKMDYPVYYLVQIINQYPQEACAHLSTIKYLIRYSQDFYDMSKKHPYVINMLRTALQNNNLDIIEEIYKHIKHGDKVSVFLYNIGLITNVYTLVYVMNQASISNKQLCRMITSPSQEHYNVFKFNIKSIYMIHKLSDVIELVKYYVEVIGISAYTLLIEGRATWERDKEWYISFKYNIYHVPADKQVYDYLIECLNVLDRLEYEGAVGRGDVVW